MAETAEDKLNTRILPVNASLYIRSCFSIPTEMARLIVSTIFPFEVLAIDTSYLLGYASSALVSASLLILLGPQTDAGMLAKAITATSESADLNQFILYDNDGKATPTMVSCSSNPVLGRLSEPTRLLTFNASAAISLQEVFEDSYCPYALVSADAKYTISLVNGAFTRKYACTHSEAHGEPLRILQALGDAEAWASMLSSAFSGLVAHSIVSVSNPWTDESQTEDVICVPVVEADNGPVSKVLVLFEQEIPHAPLAPCDEQLTPPDTHHRRSETRTHAIRLRRKSGIVRIKKTAPPESASAPIVVVVTRALLEGVRGLSLRRAAAEIGVSPTAFKMAMRRLGLCCWTCQRTASAGPGASSGPSLPPSARCRSRHTRPSPSRAASWQRDSDHRTCLETSAPAVSTPPPSGPASRSPSLTTP